jgi:hypothetical protein
LAAGLLAVRLVAVRFLPAALRGAAFFADFFADFLADFFAAFFAGRLAVLPAERLPTFFFAAFLAAFLAVFLAPVFLAVVFLRRRPLFGGFLRGFLGGFLRRGLLRSFLRGHLMLLYWVLRPQVVKETRWASTRRAIHRRTQMLCRRDTPRNAFVIPHIRAERGTCSALTADADEFGTARASR